MVLHFRIFLLICTLGNILTGIHHLESIFSLICCTGYVLYYFDYSLEVDLRCGIGNETLNSRWPQSQAFKMHPPHFTWVWDTTICLLSSRSCKEEWLRSACMLPVWSNMGIHSTIGCLEGPNRKWRVNMSQGPSPLYCRGINSQKLVQSMFCPLQLVLHAYLIWFRKFPKKL